MKVLKTVCLFLLISLGISVNAAEYTDSIPEPTALEKKTSDILRKLFPGEILDKDLKTVHKLAASPEYHAFLAEAYPNAKAIQGFEEIVNFEDPVNKILPPKDHYLPFYTEHFRVETGAEVEDTEHFLVHREVTDGWVDRAIKRGADKPIREHDIRLQLPSKAKFMRSPLFRKMLETRFGINAEVEMSGWLMTQIIRDYNMPILNMVEVQLTADAERIRGLFEKHGNVDDGLLWVAIQYPLLFHRIRSAFSTDTTFLNYVYYNSVDAEGEARKKHEKRLRDFQKWQQRQKEQSDR